jgi:predicted transposase/invertase (TIGR01784 family)
MRNTIRFDWAIKRLLRNKANFGILEGFLSELLNEDIHIESILESESNKQSAENKMNRVDLLVKNTKDELVIIEVQSDYTHDYLMRILFGTSKLIIDNMDKGMEYRRIKKIISVNIVYFDLGHGKDYIYHGTTSFVGMYKKDILTLSTTEQVVFQAEHIERIYPEYYIIKVNNFDDIANNTLDEWINFLKNEEVKEGTTARGLSEAKEKMNILRLSKEEMEAYESDLDAWRDYASSMSTNFTAGELKGKKEGKEEGKEEGKKEEKIENAKSCLKNGLSIEMAAKITGLTEDEIRNIVL